MPKKGAGYQNELSHIELGIVNDWIDHRATNGTTERTQAKQRHIAFKIIHTLHEVTGETLDTADGEHFTKVVSGLNQKLTQNSRQTLVSQLKSMVRFIQKSRTVKNENDILVDIKGGSPSKQNKGVLSLDQWEAVLNAPMSSKERAYMAMLYDGYHRPYEPYILKWSDLTINQSGSIEYTFAFKTTTPRTIVQKPETTGILEMWRKESGHNYGDDAFIFPDNNGNQYATLMQATSLCSRLKTHLNLKELKPSSIRNTSITHDVNARLPLSYICMRAWGEPYNDMINIYTKANSSQMQVDQHALNGHTTVPVVEEKPRVIKTLRECPSCKKQNAMDGSFCIYCGANLDGQNMGIVNTMMGEVAELKKSLEAYRSLVETLVERSEQVTTIYKEQKQASKKETKKAIKH